jgi:hypothetical protein
MAQTLINGNEAIADATITRSLINTGTAGSALITKVLQSVGISLFGTGADSGTGDVTLTSGYIGVTSATQTLASQTAAQPIFKNISTGGALIVSGGLYWFEVFFSLSSMSSTSGSFGFTLGGTSTNTHMYSTLGAKAATLATAVAPQVTFNTGANTAIVTASTATNGWALIKGMIRASGGGTFAPQVSLGVAAAAIVGVNSYFFVYPISETNSNFKFNANWS